ncbi:MAG TPA: hypothetical protein VLS53_00145 [Candidatus Dormibacteraeota bacterium]|nr:hypothetical protein [Candidatus Dormibacteraeota bacterium]
MRGAVGVSFGGESSYTLVASYATARPQILDRLRGQVRVGRVLIFTALTAVLVAGAIHVPPFLSAGADLASRAQRLYAGNLWAQVQVSLALTGCFVPWLVYALIWRGVARGAAILAGVSAAGSLLATVMMVVTLGTYAALPAQISGVVSRLEGRSVQLAGQRKTYYLALSDGQMASASAWLKRGAPVLMWVSPRGQIGAIEPTPIGDAD